MKKEKILKLKRERKKAKVRAKIFGTPIKPRLSVYRSLKHIYTQLIDDQNQKTLVTASDFHLPVRSSNKDEKVKKIDLAFQVGQLLAKKAKAKKIKKVVFDKGRFLYHGSLKAVAEGARKEGLEF